MHNERKEIITAKRIRKKQLQDQKNIQNKKIMLYRYIRLFFIITIFILIYVVFKAQYGWLGYISKLLLFVCILMISFFVIKRTCFTKMPNSMITTNVTISKKIMMILCLIIIWGVSFIVIKDAILDIPYLKNPQQVILYDDIIVTYDQARNGGSHYKLEGKDQQGKMYYFTLGSFEKSRITSRSKITISYLPHTNLVMQID